MLAKSFWGIVVTFSLFPCVAMSSSIESLESVVSQLGVLICAIYLINISILVFFIYIWHQHLKPWLKLNNFLKTANVISNKVRKFQFHYCSENKEYWDSVLEEMKKSGSDVTDNIVLCAILSAWVNDDLKKG